jgi:uncharacterized protein YerC
MIETVEELALRAFDIASNSNQGLIVVSLLTHKEKIAVGRRMLIAQMILAGKTRMEINNLIGVSPNTFAQVNRWLEAEFGNYSSAYTPPATSRKSASRHAKPFSYQQLKRSYPTHFLLFTLVGKLWEEK